MGRAEYWDPVTQSREPIKAGSIVNDSGLEYTPDQIQGIDNKINNLSTDVNDHKAEKATQDGYGHIRLQDIPNPVVATKAEAELGTNNTKMMTPLRVAEAFDSKVGFFDDGTIGGKQVNLLINGEWVLFQEVVDVSNLSWSDVQQIVRAGDAGKCFDIGDQLVSLYDGREIIWQVIGIDVDTPSDSNFTHSMTIQTKDCVEDGVWNSGKDNRYINSDIRAYLNSSFSGKLDPELSAVIGQVNKKVAVRDAIGGQDSFSDKVFLLSKKEVDLEYEGVATGEFVYPFYDGKGDANRIKNLDGSARIWWLRSPRVSHSYDVGLVHASGEVGHSSSYNTHGVSPACVII